MGEKVENPLSTLELQFWDRISKDYRLEIACINKSLMLIQKIDDYLYDQIQTDRFGFEDPAVTIKKILQKPTYDVGKPISKWSNSDLYRQFLKNPNQLSQMVWSLLCALATDRLLSARLLILTGHYSRVLSCVRDSNESLCWADFCLTDTEASERWLEKRKVKVPDKFEYTPPLSKHVGHPGDLDKFGTHSYLDALATSLLPQGPFVDRTEYSNSEIIRKIHTEHTIGSFGILLTAIEVQLSYLTNIRPDLMNKFSEIDDMKRAIDYVEDGLIDKLTKLNRTYSKYLKGLFSE